MKKTWIFLVISALLLLFTACTIEHAPKYTGEFSVEDYAESIDNESFHTDRIYDPIDDWRTAAEVGKQAIADRFEDTEDIRYGPRGCDVQYDKTADVWYVRTYHTSENVLGGACNVLIQSDGTVVAIWGEK